MTGDCERAAEMLSARLDGELGKEEAAALEEHLSACSSCIFLSDRFAAVDRTAALSNVSPQSGLEKEIEARIAGSVRRGGGDGLRRAAQLAAAALVLIALSLVIIATSDKADANGVTAHITALEEINDQALKYQETLLETLALDLNAMKLKVRCAELDDQDSRALLDRIEDLLGEVDRARLNETANGTNGKGDGR
jgi:predicted anti-sigma-YlaC factor YlaD